MPAWGQTSKADRIAKKKLGFFTATRLIDHAGSQGSPLTACDIFPAAACALCRASVTQFHIAGPATQV